VASVYGVNNASSAGFASLPGARCAAPNRATSVGVANNPPPAHLYVTFATWMFDHLRDHLRDAAQAEAMIHRRRHVELEIHLAKGLGPEQLVAAHHGDGQSRDRVLGEQFVDHGACSFPRVPIEGTRQARGGTCAASQEQRAS
jgi:hypothetical protein